MPDGIVTGGSILAQQMKNRAFQSGPTSGGTYGGGNSPVRTWDTILPSEFGQLAMWSGDGLLAVTDQVYPTDAPADGQNYARNGLTQTWVPVATGTGIAEAPTTGLTYTRTGPPPGGGTQPGAWVALPYIIPEAPTDGQPYNRYGNNNTWGVAFSQQAANALYAPISTVSFPEAPNDGIAYARRGWDHSWQPVATGTGLPEAPPDGNTYTRNGLYKNWTLAYTQQQALTQFAPISTVSFPEVPNNGVAYARTYGAWTPSFTQQQASLLYAPSWTVSFPEAPSDGRTYTRRGVDHSWQAVTIPTSTVPEAPTDGALYVRDGQTASWINIQTVTLDGGTY